MKNNIAQCSSCVNCNCMIKKYCSTRWLSSIEQKKTSIHYKKEQMIFHEGNLVTGIYFIYSGKVKILKRGLNDNVQIIRLAKDGEILGHRGYGEKMVYPVSSCTLEEAVICFIEKDFFFKLLKANHELTFQLMMFYSEELRKVESRLRNMTQMNVRERIADALLMIIEAFGMEEKDNTVINMQLSREEIASIAGTTSEQTTRTLSKLEKSNVIAKEGKKIKIVDLEKLQEISEVDELIGL